MSPKPSSEPSFTTKFGDEIKMNETGDEEIENFVLAAQLVQSSVLPAALNAALELDLIGIIARAGPDHNLSAKQIVSRIQINTDHPVNPNAPSMVDRLLGLLASYSIVSFSVQPTENGRDLRVYGLSKLSKFFLPDENGGDLTPLLALFLDPVVQASWLD